MRMRLIDADKIGLTDFEILMCNGDYKQALSMLIDKIEKAATAYDVDKVMEKLEVMKSDKDCKLSCMKFAIGVCKNHDKAIEIVKAGGIAGEK